MCFVLSTFDSNVELEDIYIYIYIAVSTCFFKGVEDVGCNIYGTDKSLPCFGLASKLKIFHF